MNDMDRISDRDRLERDERGNRRHEKPSGGRRERKPRNNDNKGGFIKKVLVVAVLLIVIMVVIGSGKKLDPKNLFRTWSSTNEQGVAKIFNSVQEIEDINKNLGEERGLHDRDRLYHDSYIEQMVEKEYLVYVFTGDDEKDKDFDKWVEENEEKVQIFRIDMEDITTNIEVQSYIVDEVEPMMLVYNEVDRGKKELEGVIKDARLLDEAKEYVGNLIEEKTVN